MTNPARSAALFFAPDGFDLRRPWLMGRQVAGHGFLRAAVAGRGEDVVTGYGFARFGQAFREMVKSLEPTTELEWLDVGDFPGLNRIGAMHRPDPILSADARLRLRYGPARYSLTGVTHTTASPAAMAEIAGMLSEPLMPWDAVICTSEAVAETVRRVHEASADYLRWRHGPGTALAQPMLPVIPLGVHCADFEFSAGERADARAELGFSPDTVVALFVGRRAFAAKGHPQAMLMGLQAATERTGKPVALVECGWSPNQIIANTHNEAPAEFAPGITHRVVDGRQPADARRCWAAADLFMSLSDNIQETFGLTPLEAMAAGLPAVVTDWNGYRATVRDGVDGFRIPTRALAAGFGEPLSKAAETGVLTYDEYNWGAASTTSLDLGKLADRLCELVQDADLRRRMGAAGRARARQVFDWAHVYAQYRALWGELDARRQSTLDNPDELGWLAAAPTVAPNWRDPFQMFGHYPTQQISAETIFSLQEGATLDLYRRLAKSDLWNGARAPERLVVRLWERLDAGRASLEQAAADARVDLTSAAFVLATLAKMGLVVPQAPERSNSHPTNL
jgi:glycosyltransferase involved in cell wall biosynthesis